MNIKMNIDQLVNVLKSILSEYMQAKHYFILHPSEEDRVGITTPEELRETYNSILIQAHEQGELTYLDILKGQNNNEENFYPRSEEEVIVANYEREEEY